MGGRAVAGRLVAVPVASGVSVFVGGGVSVAVGIGVIVGRGVRVKVGVGLGGPSEILISPTLKVQANTASNNIAATTAPARRFWYVRFISRSTTPYLLDNLAPHLHIATITTITQISHALLRRHFAR